MATQQPQFQVDTTAVELEESKPRSVEISDIPRHLRPLVWSLKSKISSGLSATALIVSIPATAVGVLVEGLPTAVGLALWLPFILAMGIPILWIPAESIADKAQYRINAEHKQTKRLAIEAREETPKNDFEGWLREHYNLSLKSKAKTPSWTKEEDQKIELLTAEGALLEARLVSVGDGRFELRKSRVADTAESPYFTLKSELPSLSSSLTAQREKPLAITVGRE